MATLSAFVLPFLGLEIIVLAHMLGHLLTGWCLGVPVEFRVGLGPAVPGCRFHWGRMTYVLAVLPLGGYVKLVGPQKTQPVGQSDQGPPPPQNAPVWRRLGVVAGGVLASLFLAVVCFSVVWRGPGKQQPAGVVGMVVPGSPAWEKGVPSGAWIHQIGNVHEPLYFSSLLPEVMLSGDGQELPFVYSVPPYDMKWTEITLKARKEKKDQRPLIGILGSESLQLMPRRHLPGRDHPVYLHSAAARAQPSFEFEDRIIGCTGPSKRHEGWENDWEALPRDQRNDQKDQPDYFIFARRLQQLAGRNMTVRVRRKDGKQVSVRVPSAYHWTFGLKMQMGEIMAKRNNFEGDHWQDNQEPVTANAAKEQRGDIIEQVEVSRDDGTRIRYLFPGQKMVHAKKPGATLDPAQLRFQLQQWAAQKKGDKIVTFKVRRDNREVGDQGKAVTLKKKWDDSDKWKFTSEVPLTADIPLSIPQLGLAFQVKAIVSDMDPKWKPVLKNGDVITRVRFDHLDKDGAAAAGPWREVEVDQWAYYFWAIQHTTDIKKIGVEVNNLDQEIVLEAQEDTDWPMADRGLLYDRDMRVQGADSAAEAVVMGLEDTLGKTTQVYKTLRGIVTNRISPKNLGGPVTIARVAYTIAGENFWEFVYFLGLISINLALVNCLPLPILDGGEVLFLGYEKLRRKPLPGPVRLVAYCLGGLLLMVLIMSAPQ
jgi:regulator of sigma E protease